MIWRNFVPFVRFVAANVRFEPLRIFRSMLRSDQPRNEAESSEALRPRPHRAASSQIGHLTIEHHKSDIAGVSRVRFLASDKSDKVYKSDKLLKGPTMGYYSKNGHMVTDETIRDLIGQLELLGEGVSRAAYALSDTEVLKVNIGSDWAGTNRTECAFWDALDEEDKPHFAAILAHGDTYRWIVAERVQTIGWDAYGDESDILNEWRQTDLRRLQNKYDFEDMHDGNYGIRTNGTCAVVDYAMNSQRRNGGNSESLDGIGHLGVYCSWCETGASHSATGGHGEWCEVCDGRHHADATAEHGPECAECAMRTSRTLRTFDRKTDAKVWNAQLGRYHAKVTHWTNVRLCSFCAKTDNRYDHGLQGQRGPKRHFTIKRANPDILGQLVLFVPMWNNRDEVTEWNLWGQWACKNMNDAIGREGVNAHKVDIPVKVCNCLACAPSAQLARKFY